jgi:hypothetical protein
MSALPLAAAQPGAALASPPAPLAFAQPAATLAALLPIISGALLPFFDTPSATVLRLVSRDSLAAVSAHQWEDRRTVVRGRLAAWRACFPRARAINLRGTAVTDADCAALTGVRDVCLASCPRITDAAFAHLRGAHALNLAYCTQEAITDAAFAPLRGLRRLVLSGCTQATLTDAALAPLQGSLTALTLDYCTQFSDALLAQCGAALRSLSIQWCTQEDLTDAAFAPLRCLQALDMSHCRQASITDAGLLQLRGTLQELRMVGCYQATLTPALFPHLRQLRVLDMRICRAAAREAARAAGLPLVGGSGGSSSSGGGAREHRGRAVKA